MKRGVVQSVKLGGRRMILIDSLEGRYTVTKARKAKAEGAE
jgi:hypothetical protein